MAFFCRSWLGTMARPLHRSRNVTRKRRQENRRPLGIELLEDRLAPAVTAMMNGTTLDVALGAASDTASLMGTDTTGTTIQVSGTGFTTQSFSGVTDIDVTGTGSGDAQSVELTSAGTNAISITGAISISDVASVLLDPSTALQAASFSESGAVSTTINTAAITTTGSQTYNDAVLIGTSTTLTGSTVTFGSTVDDANTAGTDSLTITGAADFGGVVGTTALASLSVSGSSTINTTAITTTGTQDYGDAVVLDQSATLSASTVTFGSTLDDGNTAGTDSLTITGAAAFDGVVGTTALASLSVSGAATIATTGITTSGIQSYEGAVHVNQSATLSASTVTFGNTLDDGSAAGTDSLTITGAAVFDGVVGTTPLASLSVSGSSSINTTVITTTGAQDYTGAVSVNASTKLTSGSITFGSTVNDGNGAGEDSLTVVASDTVTISGAVGGVAPLAALTVTAGTLAPNASITTTGAVALTSNSALVIANNITSSTAGDITLQVNDQAGSSTQNLTVNSGATLNAVSGNVILNAVQAIDLAAGSTIEASGTITVNGDFQPASGDTIGTTITVAGTVTASSMTVNGGSFADSFSITPSTKTPITVNGSDPTPPAAPGDTLVVNASSGSNPQLTLASAYTPSGYSGTWSFSDGSQAVSFTGMETLQPVPYPISLSGSPVSGNAFSALNNVVVATFSAGSNTESASDFSATIDWGDGTTSVGQVIATGNGYEVEGSHTYTLLGSYNISVTVNHLGFSSSTTTTTTASIKVELMPDGTTGTADDRFIAHIYETLLGRAVDQNGLNYWISTLNFARSYFFNYFISLGASFSQAETLGEQEAEQYVVQSIQGSAEYQARSKPTGTPDELVADDYQLLLDRSPDSLSSVWVQQLQQGVSNDTIIAMIISDPGREFYNDTLNG